MDHLYNTNGGTADIDLLIITISILNTINKRLSAQGLVTQCEYAPTLRENFFIRAQVALTQQKERKFLIYFKKKELKFFFFI